MVSANVTDKTIAQEGGAVDVAVRVLTQVWRKLCGGSAVWRVVWLPVGILVSLS